MRRRAHDDAALAADEHRVDEASHPGKTVKSFTRAKNARLAARNRT
ncbi:hypothetical protein GWL_10490 [Herbaspirillum sp. GW103]|nr:hypothetical protein GWL_10490 [Herbaspirillum sp. GW103]